MASQSFLHLHVAGIEFLSKKKPTHHIDCVCATQTLRIIRNNIGGLVNTLHRARFYIKLLVTEALLSTQHAQVSCCRFRMDKIRIVAVNALALSITAQTARTYLSWMLKFQSVTAPYPKSFRTRTFIVPMMCLSIESPTRMILSKRPRISQTSSLLNPTNFVSDHVMTFSKGGVRTFHLSN